MLSIVFNSCLCCRQNSPEKFRNARIKEIAEYDGKGSDSSGPVKIGRHSDERVQQRLASQNQVSEIQVDKILATVSLMTIYEYVFVLTNRLFNK